MSDTKETGPEQERADMVEQADQASTLLPHNQTKSAPSFPRWGFVVIGVIALIFVVSKANSGPFASGSIFDQRYRQNLAEGYTKNEAETLVRAAWNSMSSNQRGGHAGPRPR